MSVVVAVVATAAINTVSADIAVVFAAVVIACTGDGTPGAAPLSPLWFPGVGGGGGGRLFWTVWSVCSGTCSMDSFPPLAFPP